MEADEFTLDMGDEVPSAKAQVGSKSIDKNKYLAGGQPKVPGGVLGASIRPHAPRLIAEDPEKRRIVGRPARTPPPKAGPKSGSPVKVQGPEPALPPPEPPAPPVFEGSGLAEVGSLRKQQKAAAEEDDEFSYALEGGKREQEFHKQVYRPKAMPAHLVSNVKQRLNTEVLEEADEEEEEEEVGDVEEEGDGFDDGAGLGAEAASAEEEDKQQQSRSRDKQAGCSWTTFAVSEGPTESLADESDPAKPPVEAPADTPSAAGNAASAEDLPSYKLLQALHVTGPSTIGAPGGPGGALEAASAVVTAVSSDDNPRRAADVLAPGALPAKEHSPLRAMDEGTRATSPSRTNGSTAAAAGSAASAAGVGALTAAPRRPLAASDAAPSPLPPPEDEWEAANRERQLELQQRTDGPPLGVSTTYGSAVPSSSSPPLTYHQALLHFLAMDTSHLRSQVLSSLPPPPGLFSRLLCLGPPDLKRPLLREQLMQLLALARLPFNDGDPMHVRLLGALYGAFTGKTTQPPRYGSHWEELGFQGQDPATDLRGCGMLGLLQLFYLTSWSAEAAAKMLKLSRHPVQEFPLSIVSLNVTKWTLQALRAGQLHRAANSGDSMVEAVQQFYAGAMATFYAAWRGGRKTMVDSGHVLKSVEALALKKPGLMLSVAQRPELLESPPDAA